MAYRLHYADYPGTASGPPDPERWVGPPGPTGPAGPTGPMGPPGSMTTGGTMTAPLLFTTNTRLGMDTAAYGGVPNMYMYSNGGAVVFYADGWNEWTPAAFRGINFKVFGNGGADEYWGITGGPEGNGATLKVYSVSGGWPCIGSILASNEGQLFLGNDTGTILNLKGPTGSLSMNSLQILSAGSGVAPILRATGEAGVDLSLGSSSYGSVLLGNSNGPLMVVSDYTQGSGARNAFFTFSVGTGSSIPAIGISTSGIPSPPASLSLSISSNGGGDIILGNSNGPTLIVSDPTDAGHTRQTYLYMSGTTSSGSAGIRMANDGIPGAPTSASFGITSLGNASVILGNSNGAIASFADGGAPSTPRNAYFVFAAGVSSVAPVLSISTGGISSPPADVSLQMKSVGAGGFVLHNDTTAVFLRAEPGSNLMLGGPSNLATTATSGFIQIPAVAGTPTGVPVNATGGVTLVYDTTANKLWAYNGAWRSGTFT